ncbi:hypothetical protein NU08_2725 [Flavobacterium anhuiense]|uniref:Uncharacterized protein n=1 Tax=Flavobacterium anhuiense TaxID=459526 RepID=A0A444VWZ5_9FLAO|nr:hypothetical protein NU08_2725 [Flavobacterium anhuiense]
MLIPKLPKGILNSKNVAPELQLALPDLAPRPAGITLV